MSGLFVKSQDITTSDTKVGALRVQQSSQGVPIAVVFGTTRVTPNLIWYGNFRAIANTTQTKQGGKGGGGTTVTNTTYTYTVGMAHALCEGPLSEGSDSGGIDRVWATKEASDFSGVFRNTGEEFLGTYTQSAWSFLTTNFANQALNYRGTVYAASPTFPLGGSDSLPNLTYEIRGFSGTSTGSPFATTCTPDANPGDIMSMMLTNDALGSDFFSAGFPADSLGDLTEFTQYCGAANFMVSPAYTAQRAAADIVAELARVGNSGIVWSEGLLKVRPYADEAVQHTFFQPGPGPNPDCCAPGDTISYTPSLTVQYHLTYDDFLAPEGSDPIIVRRKRQADAFNAVQVKCLDRGNDYNEYVAEAKDQANIDKYGLRVMEPLNLPLICDPNIARSVAQTVLQRELYIRNKYSFTVGWRYARLEPMDIVSLTDPKLGFDQLPVRIVDIEESEEGELRISAEDLTVGVSTPGSYDTQVTDGYQVNALENPGPTSAPVIFQPPVELSGVPQIWIGAAGGEFWGGAQVWVSDDDATYAQVGTISAPARYGVLTANFPAGSNPDTVNTLSVDLTISSATLTSATASQADAQQTLSFVGANGAGELIAYSVANLTSPFNYDLDTYITRGQRCTISEFHAAGESFMRLDGAVAQFDINLAQVGTTLYIKLLSFNTQGGGLLELDTVTAIEYEVLPIGVVAVSGTVPSTINAGQVLCVPPDSQYSVLGRMTCAGRINCDGTLIVS